MCIKTEGFKELAPVIMEADMTKICRVGQQVRESGRANAVFKLKPYTGRIPSFLAQGRTVFVLLSPLIE